MSNVIFILLFLSILVNVLFIFGEDILNLFVRSYLSKAKNPLVSKEKNSFESAINELNSTSRKKIYRPSADFFLHKIEFSDSHKIIKTFKDTKVVCNDFTLSAEDIQAKDWIIE